MQRRLAVAAMVIGATVVSTGIEAPPGRAAAPTVARYAGADRYATAADVSAATFTGPVPVVFVARGDAFPDALAAGPAAAVDGGPVLLVGSSVPAATAAELTRLHPARIVVLGGPLAVPDGVVAALRGFTTGSVSRIAGPDRYATAAAVSNATFSPGVGAVYVAGDASFADALTAAAAAGHDHDPVLLVQPGQIPPATAQELTRLRPQSIVVLGGSNAVSANVAVSLATYTTGSVTRLAGADRYATAVAVSQHTYPGTSASVYVATGLAFPDALAGGVAAALAPAPLLLVPGTCVPPGVVSEITRLGPSQLVILGGAGAVGPAVESLTQCAPPPVGGAPGCFFSSGARPAFCDTFAAPAGIGNRSGDLNGTVWGVSRSTGNQALPSPANGWFTTQTAACGATASVRPPHDVVICGGRLHDAVTDGGNVTTLAMYPKQPFDFGGRTGAIVFDVSNDTQGSHAAWPELWVTDQPVPTPFAHEGTFLSLPRNGFGVRFAGCAGGTCPRGDGTVGVDSAIVVNNLVPNDSFNGGSLQVHTLGSVTESNPGQLNHYEVDVSQNQIDVYGTDAFTPGSPLPPLVHLATIPNAGLTLTRGLVWIEDAHYNADKFSTQGTHTFTWANFGFDGPVLPRDLTFDVLDNTASGDDLGYAIPASSSIDLTAHSVYNTAAAAGALLTFNFYLQTSGITVNFAINGHAHTLAWPFPDGRSFSPLTIGVPIPVSDVQDGDNTITFSTGNFGMTVMNVDIILIGAGGVVAP